MSPENFLKTDEAKKCKNVAFTSDEKKVIHTWMKQYAKHIIKEDQKAKRQCSQ
ncbi:hypothetical protein M1M25_gp019 [Tenacibaculum phage Gundel_1]|uniref:Uncharacterized protein n=1 Tax=Tenacibaculum phage Gundel_1 TaxID=2745672 RepID=A0A8E5EBK3_9CAUD|nr:hypothetical protein M1M25_gp019 [Tenacibaculum phage Gundel_1]QQV91449.1 hypothetical protein Gundel1_19 [Tenacibaculum phage Gundel_1]